MKPNLRTVTWEEQLRKLLELLCPLEVKTQLCEFFKIEGCISNGVILTVYTIQIHMLFMVGHVTPHKIMNECYLLRSYLVNACRMLLFMVKRVFLLMGEVWSMHNLDTVHGVRVRGAEKGVKGQRRIFMFKFFCLAIKYKFHFTV